MRTIRMVCSKCAFFANLRVLFACLFFSLTAAPALADPVHLEFDTELLSLELVGGPVPMPLASDPGNALGDSVDGYGFVDSIVTFTLSSQRSVSPGPQSFGKALATTDPGGVSLLSTPGPINPSDLDGQTMYVDSFFDVFFDVTVTDVDPRPGRIFAGQANGASLTLTDNGPAHMGAQYSVPFDVNTPNFGIIPPPEVNAYLGVFNIEVPLGGDINSNGENDKIKFTLITHQANDLNRTFITLPNGTVIDSFDSEVTLDGAVADVSGDPPFTIHLVGPGSSSSTLLNEIVPEPSSATLLVLGALLAAAWRRA